MSSVSAQAPGGAEPGDRAAFFFPKPSCVPPDLQLSDLAGGVRVSEVFPEAGSVVAVSPQGRSLVFTELGAASLHGLCHPVSPSSGLGVTLFRSKAATLQKADSVF